MNFLNNLGPWELAVIVVLAILLVGPKRVLQIIQSIREFAGKLRQMSSEFTALLQAEVREVQDVDREVKGVERETGKDLKTTVQEILNPFAAVQSELQAAAQEMRQALDKAVQEELGPIGGIQPPAQATDTAPGVAQEDTGPAIGGIRPAPQQKPASTPSTEEKAG